MLCKKSMFPTNKLGQKIISNQHDLELSNLEDSSRKEFCQNIEDLKNAETTIRLIDFVAEKTTHIINDKENKNSKIIDYYISIITNEPITIDEQNYLLEFLKDENSFKIAQNIFSKLILLQWNENNYFIQNFLKNSEWKLDITQFINYLINMLTNYKLIFINCDEIKFIHELNNNKFYKYKLNWKTWLFVVKDNEIFCLNWTFENIKILENWFIFIVKENKVIDRDFEKPYEEKIWILYKFNWSDFEILKKMPWIIDITKLNETNYLSSWENWKKWLIEIIEINTEVTRKLNIEYDRLNIKWQFILTWNNLEDNKYKLWVHINTANWCEKLLEEECIEEDFITSNYKKLVSEFQVINENYVQIETINWTNIYKYDKNDNSLKIVPWLEAIHSIWNIIELFNWTPIYIKYENWRSWLYTFNKETWELICIFFDINNKLSINNPKFDWDKIEIIWANFDNLLFWKNAKLYTLKKWYKLWDSSRELYICKWFFWPQIKTENNFEKMKEYLEEAILPIIIK